MPLRDEVTSAGSAGRSWRIETRRQESPQKLERELTRCRAALIDSQDRHRDTARLLERLSGQNAELRDELERSQEKIGNFEYQHDDCEAKPAWLWTGDDKEQCVALRLKARETIQALEARVQAAFAEKQRWQQRCQELEALGKQSTLVSPDAQLANVELGNLRHRVWQLEQDLQAEKRLAAELRAELDRRQAMLTTARREVDEGRGHVVELRQQVSELKELLNAASEECRQEQQERQLVEQRMAEDMEEQQQTLTEQHMRETECLHLELRRLQQELQTLQRNRKVDCSETMPPTMPLQPPRSTSAWVLGSVPASSTARPPDAAPPSWSAGDSSARRKCRQCEYFYFSSDGAPETGRKCRLCQYFYFSPDGPGSPNAGSYVGSSSPSRSPKRARMPGAMAAAAEERAASTRVRLEMSALELALQQEKDAVVRSEQEARRGSEAAAEQQAASKAELLHCRARTQQEKCSAAAWQAEAEALAAQLRQESLGSVSTWTAASNSCPGSPEPRAGLWEELFNSRAEIDRLEQQSHVWERRRNLWEERCVSREGELEQALRKLSTQDAQQPTVQRHLAELEASDDVSPRLVFANANALTSIQEDGRSVLTESQACHSTETDRCDKVESELEDLRARHEMWRVALEAAAVSAAALGTHAAGLHRDDRDAGSRQSNDEEVSQAIESHICCLAERLSSPQMRRVA